MTDRIATQTTTFRDRDRLIIPPGRYVWRGPPNSPVFAMENCRDVVVDGVDVVCESPAEAAFLMERTKTGPGTIPSTMHMFRNVRIYGVERCGAGVFYRPTIDENNEHCRCDSVSVYNCGVGFSFRGQQSKEHLLTHCRTEGCDVGVIAESSFQWIGGTCAIAQCGVELYRVGDPVKIQGVGFEACGRLLLTSGPTTDAQPVVLDSCRFAADQLHDDGAMIVMRHAGPLTIIGGSYGDGNQRVPHIQLTGIGEQAVTIIGAKFGAFGASQVNPVRANPGVEYENPAMEGCTYERPQGVAEHTATSLEIG